MIEDRELMAQRMAEWSRGIAQLDLPDWDKLPQLELYMDQVIILLTQYLAPLTRGEDEKAITASTINNYVRMKVMPPPVKKKYARLHLAYLIIICILKQNLSISCIQRMLPAQGGEENIRQFYNSFVAEYRSAAQSFLRQVDAAAASPQPDQDGSAVTSAAILSNLAKSLTEFLLQEEDSGDEDDD